MYSLLANKANVPATQASSLIIMNQFENNNNPPLLYPSLR
jgi:hypothetical protein